jgi:hypothetical protein
MFALFCFVLALLTSPFKSKSRLEAENAALRHQLIVFEPLNSQFYSIAELDSSGPPMWAFGHSNLGDRWIPVPLPPPPSQVRFAPLFFKG